MGLTVITPSGDRPEAIALLRRWMSRQTVKPDQWLIVDDGQVPYGKIHEAQVIRREPRPDDPPCTLGVNLATALPLVEHDHICICEDDDAYSPHYLETMTGLLKDHRLTGVWGTKCYHIEIPAWRLMGREDHASLSQTAFRKDVIPELMKCCEGDCQVDLRLWFSDFGKEHGHLIDGSRHHLQCSMKGLPGRPGAGVGHIKEGNHYEPDPDYKKLREWVYDWEDYQKPFRVKNRLVVYTAIAGSGRDELTDPVSPVPGVDYVCFTDQPFRSRVWDIRPFTWLHPSETVRTAKHPKILPHLYFPDYDLSVWLDGNITPKSDVEQLTKRVLEQHDMAFHRHPRRSCLYDEAQVVIQNRQDHEMMVEANLQRYRLLQVPRELGLMECGILFRRHHDSVVKDSMALWWDEICAGTNNDQIPMAYAMWVNDLLVNWIEMNLRDNPSFIFKAHETLKWGEVRQCA